MHTSMAVLFEHLGHPFLTIPVGVPINVEEKRVVIESFDFQRNEIVWARVTRIIRKADAAAFQVSAGNAGFECSGEHEIAVTRRGANAWHFVPVSELEAWPVPPITRTRTGSEPVAVIPLSGNTPILDIEVEGTACYFSDGILSHNTMFGNPETVPGGMGQNFASVIRVRMGSAKIKDDPLEKTSAILEATGTVKKNQTYVPNLDFSFALTVRDHNIWKHGEIQNAEDVYRFGKKLGLWGHKIELDGIAESFKTDVDAVEWLHHNKDALWTLWQRCLAANFAKKE